ncbi:30S ribosomal protein S12 [Formosa agariphila KMM 3901]|uniref:30S ribosomal protein S12 n=1 Tax=Formosa agariphila (strain DSM 15362 / KCTC 12365 / LMG 23005 / KMM 3901 / M-2Alg 35-1) TaxID=1347342 RepID=T2KJV0_FORAG|nr:surface antigen (D15) [Formosa agariphila]CDF78269.1 30S ribosomal protein S12 [Formosa agariphila KMM 3901]
MCQNLSLNIEGHTAQQTKIIDSIAYQKNHINYQSITNALDSLSNTLNHLGYIEHNIIDSNKINDSTVVSVFNLKNKYSSLYIRYTNIETLNLESLNINFNKEYIVLLFKNVQNTLNRLNSEIANQGLPFTALHLENFKIENDSVKADLKISKKTSPRHIDKIIIKGYQKFPRKFINQYAQIKTGQVFNMNEIILKTKNINSLPFANLIRDPEVLFTKDSTTLYIYVEKQKSNNFDGYLGFTTNEDTNKLEFSGYLNMLLRNNLNFGESVKLLYESDENEQKTFNFNIDMPYLFKSPIGANVDLNIFKKDSTFTTVDQSLKLYYQFSTQHKLYLGIKESQSNNLLNQNSLTTIEDYKSTFYSTTYNFTKTDDINILFPIKTYANVNLGLGHRTYENTKEQQFEASLDLYHTFYLNEKNSIFTRIEAAALQSETYLENELLRYGGINSIRGFEENSILANLYSVLNIEYRFQLNPTIFVHTISDFSYLENKISNQKERLIGLGVGFAVLTKAGLLKLNYANGKTENSPFNISNAKVHLSITTIF